MSLAAALRHLYPAADPARDFEVADRGDGKGPVLAKWDAVKLGAQPSPAQIEQAKANAANAETTAANARTADRSALVTLRDKMQGGQSLTAAEQRQLLLVLIRRSRE